MGHGLAMFLEKEFDKGRVIGSMKGWEEGRREGRIETFLCQARAKYQIVPEQMEKHIRKASTEQVDTWFDRLQTADTLDSVFEPAKG